MSLQDPQLQAFIKVAEHQSVHAAAAALFISQTAVTQRLKGLETKLGVSLFSRTRRGMLLTQEGEVLQRYCQNSLALESETLAQIQGVGQASHVRVGLAGPTSILQARVVPVMQQLAHAFPSVLFDIHYCDNNEAQALLKTGTVQFSILPTEAVNKELEVQSLIPEQYLLVGTKKWKSRVLKEVLQTEKIIDFNNNDQMTFAYLKQFKLLKHASNERHFADHPEAIAELVKAGCGYSVLEKSFVERYLHKGSLVDLNPGKIYTNAISLAWYSRPTMPAYLQFVVDGLSNAGD